MRLMLVTIAAAMSLSMVLYIQDAKAHWQPGTHNATHAILLAFCGRANYICRDGINAIKVAKCESSSYWWRGRAQEAHNGQYLGMFQMGSRERYIYGHGPDPWSQAFAAHRYFLASGRTWWPWSCKPW